MTDNVVKLGRREPLVWVCNCGCSTFRLLSDGSTECASCEVIGLGSNDGAEWCVKLPDPPANPKPEDFPREKVVTIVDHDVALRRTLDGITVDGTVGVIVICEDGRVRTWGGVDTQERLEWLDHRLADAKDLLTMWVKDGKC